MSISSFIKKISRNSPRLVNEIAEFPETLSLIKRKLYDNRNQNEIEELKYRIKNSNLRATILFLILLVIIFFGT